MLAIINTYIDDPDDKSYMIWLYEEFHRLMLNDYPDVMSIDEMCRALSIGKKTGYKLLQTGQIRFLKIGRAYRIPKINLLEYLQVIRPE